MFCRYEERKGIKFYATEGLAEVYDLRTVTSELGILCTDSPTILIFIDKHNPLKLKWLDCSKMPPQVITTSSLHERWVKDICVAREKNVSKTQLLVGTFIKMANKIQAVNIQSDQIQWTFEGYMLRMKKELQPRGITSDDQEHLFVCDEANSCVQIFSVSNGKYLGTLLKKGDNSQGVPRGIRWHKESKYLTVSYTEPSSVRVCVVKLN